MKYTPKSKIALADILNRTGHSYHQSSINLLDPKHLPARPPNIHIPKNMPKDSPYQLPMTPKTARTTYRQQPTNNSSFNRPSHLTPDDDKSKKDASFNTPIRPKPAEPVDSSFQKDPCEAPSELKTARADRSHRVLKTALIKENVAIRDDKSFLRQTVSNANIWRNSKNVSPSPIKPLLDIRKDEKFSETEEIDFRKKIESEYTPSFMHTSPTSDDYAKDFKSKIYSTTHSRQNSGYLCQPKSAGLNSSNSNGLEPLNFKNKGMQSSRITPRASQDKLTMSVNIRKLASMNQTDPLGAYYQTARENASLRLSARIKEPAISLSIEDFQLGSCKGEGRFGKVYPAIHKKTGCLVAIKQIKKEELRLMIDQFVQQLKINLYANHPNIVKMYGFFSDRTYFYILMEYMEEGSLYKHIKVQKKLKQQEAATKLYEICDALNYLHNEDVLHRDIKPQNIVLSNGVCKLCDFGWATYSKERRTTYCGTLDYVCPQILEGDSYDNFVDIWAIGVLAYEMLTGKAPFYHISRKQTMKSIMNCDFSFPFEMSVSAKMFIKKALQKNPDQRFTIESLLKDRFLSSSAPFC